jgi:hypothetical protein
VRKKEEHGDDEKTRKSMARKKFDILSGFLKIHGGYLLID